LSHEFIISLYLSPHSLISFLLAKAQGSHPISKIQIPVHGGIMRFNRKSLLATLSIIPFIAVGPALSADTSSSPQTTLARPDQASIESMTADWPSKVKEAIGKTMQKYGPPDEVGTTMVMWHNPQGSFKHIHIHKEEVPHNFPMPHTDFVKEVIDYQVPVDKADEITAYDGSVTFNRTKGTMAAMCDKEEMNFLALNLAHDIATGKRTVSDARQFYGKTAMAFMKGEKSNYTQGLLFNVATSGTADPDQKLDMPKQ
jgi:hypothetical protein